MTRAFEEAARDPRLIPGVHRSCDEWCEMCPVTTRCLSFRCMAIFRKEKGRREGEPTFRSSGEAMEFSRRLAAAERPGAPELEIPPSDAALRTGDPLASMAWQYGLAVSLWLVLTPEDLRSMRAAGQPSPEEVVLYYHLRIYLKLVRALVASDPRPGRRGPGDDATGLAKLALVSVERSRKAMLLIKSHAGQEQPALLGMLRALEQGIEERFPHVRQHLRIGLDTIPPEAAGRRQAV